MEDNTGMTGFRGERGDGPSITVTPVLPTRSIPPPPDTDVDRSPGPRNLTSLVLLQRVRVP